MSERAREGERGGGRDRVGEEKGKSPFTHSNIVKGYSLQKYSKAKAYLATAHTMKVLFLSTSQQVLRKRRAVEAEGERRTEGQRERGTKRQRDKETDGQRERGREGGSWRDKERDYCKRACTCRHNIVHSHHGAITIIIRLYTFDQPKPNFLWTLMDPPLNLHTSTTMLEYYNVYLKPSHTRVIILYWEETMHMSPYAHTHTH